MVSTVNELKITAIDKASWRCESGSNVYKIQDFGQGHFNCTCPARVECKHIKAVKQDFLSASSPPAVFEPLKSKGFRRSILEILADFQKPIPDRFIKTKVLKGQKIPFVSWYSYIKLLDFYAPGFNWQVRTHHNGDRTVVEGRLTILALEGDFFRESTGTEDNDLESWGDPSSNAEAMALRRCCAKFGLGLSLWEK